MTTWRTLAPPRTRGPNAFRFDWNKALDSRFRGNDDLGEATACGTAPARWMRARPNGAPPNRREAQSEVRGKAVHRNRAVIPAKAGIQFAPRAARAKMD